MNQIKNNYKNQLKINNKSNHCVKWMNRIKAANI